MLLSAEVIGDTVIYVKVELIPDLIVNQSFICKQIRISEKGCPDRYVGVYEDQSILYAYSDKTTSFHKVADFSVQEDGVASVSGLDYQVTRKDYIYPEDILRMRMLLSNGEDEICQVYGVGSSFFYAPADSWNNPGRYEFISCEIPGLQILHSSVFDEPIFIPENTYYTIGKEWTKFSYDPWMPDEMNNTSKYIVKGDMEYEHIPCRNIEILNSDNILVNSVPGCDSKGKVYRYDGEVCRLRLALDFNLKIGDVASPFDVLSEVIDIDEITVNDIQYKRIIFKGVDQKYSNGDDSIWRYWVEGIGESNGNIMYPQPMPSFWQERTDECMINGVPIFTYADFSIQSSIKGLSDLEPDSDYRITYDVMGRQIKETVPGSIYIRGGKKFVAK